MIHTCYIQLIYFTVQNGQQDILELNFVSFPHLESSEHDVDKSDNPYIRISVLEEKNETLEKQKEALEKQIEKLKKELEIALSGSGVVQSKEEQFRSTSMQQVIKECIVRKR